MSPVRLTISQESCRLCSLHAHGGDLMQKKDFLTVLGRKATKDILEILDGQDKAYYKDFRQVASMFTVNSILRNLIDLELIQLHRAEHEKKEWYESTEKGKKVLQYLRELEELIRE